MNLHSSTCFVMFSSNFIHANFLEIIHTLEIFLRPFSLKPKQIFCGQQISSLKHPVNHPENRGDNFVGKSKTVWKSDHLFGENWDFFSVNFRTKKKFVTWILQNQLFRVHFISCWLFPKWFLFLVMKLGTEIKFVSSNAITEFLHWDR